MLYSLLLSGLDLRFVRVMLGLYTQCLPVLACSKFAFNADTVGKGHFDNKLRGRVSMYDLELSTVFLHPCNLFLCAVEHILHSCGGSHNILVVYMVIYLLRDTRIAVPCELLHDARGNSCTCQHGYIGMTKPMHGAVHSV